MRRRIWLIGGVLALGVGLWWLIPGGGQNVLEGLFGAETTSWYSASQAEQGQKLATQKCTVCHGKHLEGKVGPQLIGTRFLSRWSGKSGAELAQFIQTRMPLTRPGSLSPNETVLLVAYILKGNGYPAGEQDLSLESAAQLKLTAPKTNHDSDTPGY